MEEAHMLETRFSYLLPAMNSVLHSCLILGHVLHRSAYVLTCPCVHVLVCATDCVCLCIYVGVHYSLAPKMPWRHALWIWNRWA